MSATIQQVIGTVAFATVLVFVLIGVFAYFVIWPGIKIELNYRRYRRELRKWYNEREKTKSE
jgi:hypothetical protein